MRAFESVRYQDQAARLVESALESGRLAHAYVFSGPQGVGRLTAALGLAASLVCERQAGSGYCGGCRQCERVFRFDHPDVRVTVPVTGSTTEEQLLELFQRRATDGISPLEISGKGYIGIAQVRAISQRLSRRAFENRGRVEIISGAESMRVEAANALLKTLEEPPPGVHLILTTSSFSSLLPTVRSRSQLVRFRRIPAAAVARELEEKLQVDPSCAMRIAAACNGSLGKALLMASSGESPVVERAREVLDAALREPVSGVLAMCSALARKHGAEGVLDLVMELRALVHDLIRRWHGKCCLYHPEEDLPDLGGDRERYLVEMTGKLDTCERRIRRNVAPSMALEAALLGARAGAAG